MGIELPWPENLANTCACHTETMDNCSDLIRAHQQYTPWSPPLEIEPTTTEPKLYHWVISPHHTQVMPNQLLVVIAQTINLNVSCKLLAYSLQRTRSPPRPRLPKRIGNTHSHNWYNLKGKDIDIHFSFLSRGIILWIELRWLVDLASPVSDVDYGSVVEFQLCILWSLVRYPGVEITVYTADET